jgi:hypothetical protein
MARGSQRKLLDHELMPSTNPEEKNREERRQEFWRKELGMPPPEWLDDSLAPPIGEKEREQLRQYARREISDESLLRELTVRTLHFRSWANEYSEICAQELRNKANDKGLGKEPS